MAADNEVRVVRRRVFYIPGYDPFPARRYRELFRSQAARQAAISGYEVETEGRAGDPSRWTARGEFGAQTTEARFEVLGWADIVQRSMTGGLVGVYRALILVMWTYLRRGTFFRIGALRKGPAIAGLYPVLMLIAELGAAVALGALTFGLFASASTWAGWLSAASVAILALAGFRWADRWLYAHYLIHDFAFTASADGAVPEPLVPRLAAFRQKVAAALDTDVDEVLLVGHSSGSELAVRVAAALLREGAIKKGGPALGLLTLGQSIPVVSCLPGGEALRADLARLSVSDRIAWVDVSAPGDGCAFALCDPVAVSGMAGAGQRWPLIVSAAFRQTMSPERWRRLRWRFFQLHFQYICAFERPGRYDYFAITTGPLTLARRFDGHSPSPTRIDRVAA